MELPDQVREAFREYGRIGGRRRAARMSPSARKGVGVRAATTRWIRARFGSPSFASLGVPGGDLVDAGLADLAFGRTTLGSLLVSLAAPRLRREGVPITRVEADPERRLHALLVESEGDLAHARYGAYLQRMVSFANACPLARVDNRDSSAA